MTTIAVRKGLIACDSRVSSDDGISVEIINKVWFSKRHPVAYCVAGTLANASAMTHIIDAHTYMPWEKPKLWNTNDRPSMVGSRMLIVCKDGRTFCIEEQGWYESTGPYHALGTGAMAALAAMKMGASAKRAVEIAITLDQYSGAPVHLFKLEDIGNG